MDSVTAYSPDVNHPELTGTWGPATAAWPAREAATYATDRLHPGVFGLLAGTYGAMLLVLWLIFATDIEASISVGICTVYFAVYFGVPWAMNRLARQAEPQPAAGSLGRFLRGQLITYTGRISGLEAVVQMLIVPVGITLAFVCIGVIIQVTG